LDIYLFFSDIHYPEFEPGKIWHGDIFSINGWIKHDFTPLNISINAADETSTELSLTG